jgi:hypothetical protein
MSNTHAITPESSLLAEAVATGLHSLAQPLTAAQWCLESAVMNNPRTEYNQRELSEALVAIEGVVAKLNILRDIIRPFRMETKYTSESVREALLNAIDEQREVLLQEGVQIGFSEQCAEGIVVTPQGYLQRIALLLFGLLRSLGPVAVIFDISETNEHVLLRATLAYRTKSERREPEIQSCSTIRSYVEVLTGEFSVASDLSSVRLSLPKRSSSI